MNPSAWERDYPALWQFLGSYLHQDWRDEYATPDEALMDFVAGEPASVPQLVADIDKALETAKDDDEAEHLLISLGSFYVPSRSGESARAWLQHLRTRLNGSRER